MKRLPNLEINENLLRRLLAYQLRSGGEAIICPSIKPNRLFKIMADATCQRNCDSLGVPFSLDNVLLSDQKFAKIKRLYELQLEHSVQPLRTITMNGRLIGFEMTYDKNDKSLVSAKLSQYELLHFLAQSRKVLQYYNAKDIIYGDVSSNNILINQSTGLVKFCDMDNVYLDGLPFDAMGRDLKIYSIIGGPLQYTDAYMHNVTTLQAFQEDKLSAFFEPVAYLVQKDYSTYLTDEAKKTLISMEEPTNFNGEYIIQYAKK